MKITGWEADTALTWFSAFASLLLMVGFAIWFSTRASTALWVLLCSLVILAVTQPSWGQEKKSSGKVEKKTSSEEVNAALKSAAEGPLKGILSFSTEDLVSVDFKGNANSSIVDAPYTKVMDGDFVKVLSWYDNEWGYSSRCVDLIRLLVKKGI